jgi:N-acetylglucosamine kinase-like BadF-type ATPase
VSAATVLGLDIGGTWTRALVVDVGTGSRSGASRREGANPITHGVEAASVHIAAAVTEALADADRVAAQIDACVIGMAGASKLAGDPAAAEAVAELWRRIGIGCPVRIVADVTTAFAAGTAEPDGSILLAGTGAIAAIMRDRRPTAILGGHGWLLGDEGSGVWIGREAVRATLAALDRGAEPSGLTKAVLAEIVPEPVAGRAGAGAGAAAETGAGAGAGVGTGAGAESDFGLGEGRRLAAATIAAANARPPVHLAALVPLVLTAADEGDHDAERILHETADLLVAMLERARGRHATQGASDPAATDPDAADTTAADPAAPIVLAGGVLAPGSRVHRLVRAAVTEAWPKAVVTEGVDGAAAAAWLAALHLLGDGQEAAALHACLLRTT